MKPNGWPGWMMPAKAIRDAAASLAAVSDTPRLDAEMLLAHALGVDRNALLLNPPAAAPPEFSTLLARRIKGEPIAYIIGTRDFWTITLAVGRGVLIPRPDSETLIDAAIAHFGTRAPQSILDLGTGPGTLLLAALDQWPDATGLGVDASDAALDYAQRNAAAIAPGRADFRKGNWAAGITEHFDLIMCNPPYVEDDAALESQVRDYEPAEALFAGPDGLNAYRVLIPQLPPLMAPGGAAIIEIGWQQASAVSAMVRAAGMFVTVRQDLGGRDRALILSL
jgi:release factor glutamine methyltransferase